MGFDTVDDCAQLIESKTVSTSAGGSDAMPWAQGVVSSNLAAPTKCIRGPYSNHGIWSGMFGVDYRERLQPGNLTKYPISGDKMIH